MDASRAGICRTQQGSCQLAMHVKGHVGAPISISIQNLVSHTLASVRLSCSNAHIFAIGAGLMLAGPGSSSEFERKPAASYP